ncbi:solute carrier family 35 member B1 homolog meigo [Ptiloglossa arizonensis]|uniref:solute carrier family 35 member B1 homolog meigo n=1 Tax=Ptiloglossa arizonensis TaxID=3350558 RepID=UPI003FA18906
MDSSRRFKLLLCTLGVFVCYFHYAILQEKITRGQYGDEKNSEKFTYMFTLVFTQCLINYLFAKTILLTVMKQGEDTTPTTYYAISALTYLLAMVCSNMALQFVSYPTQVVGKAGKPIPVMILGVLLGNKVYPIKKYFFVFLVVIGVVLFMFKDGASSKQAEAQTAYAFGELLLLLSLTMDGLTSAIQERMRAEYNSKSGHMMMNMNIWSVIFSSAVILISGEFFEFIQFICRYPSTLWLIITLSVAGAFGQYFIFLTVVEFGPLPCSIITTTRKFFTVLGSILIFGNTLAFRQWIGTFAVFTGLLLDAMFGKDKSIKKNVVM